MKSTSSPAHALVYSVVSGPTTGLKIVVPGLPQWSWQQRGRAGVLLGSYLAAWISGIFAWGTPAGPAMLGFAFLTHVASVADVVRQRAFPGFGRWVPFVSASTGLGMAYAPVLGALWMVAWPGELAGNGAQGYLVNLWAFRQRPPAAGDWVWVQPRESGSRLIGKVLAGGGQEAEWFEGALRVDGVSTDPPRSVLSGSETWTHLLLTVPEGHVLVAPLATTPAVVGAEAGPVLVEATRIQGRVWAQHTPIWQRRLLR